MSAHPLFIRAVTLTVTGALHRIQRTRSRYVRYELQYGILHATRFRIKYNLYSVDGVNRAVLGHINPQHVISARRLPQGLRRLATHMLYGRMNAFYVNLTTWTPESPVSAHIASPLNNARRPWDRAAMDESRPHARQD